MCITFTPHIVSFGVHAYLKAATMHLHLPLAQIGEQKAFTVPPVKTEAKLTIVPMQKKKLIAYYAGDCTAAICFASISIVLKTQSLRCASIAVHHFV